MLALLLGLMLSQVDAPTTPLEFERHSFFEMTPDMVTFLEEHVLHQHNDRAKLDALLRAIFSEDGLGMTYSNNETLSPQDTFRTRTGNCLSFTGMFIAMARYCGFFAGFQEVSDISSYEQNGHFTVLNRHINAIVFINGRQIEVDFNSDRSREFRLVHHATDLRGIAHYYNNLGAECLARHEYDMARNYFNKSIEIDPSFSQSWTNFGVLERLSGNYNEAEACYLKAQSLNQFNHTAKMNLAHLYTLQGKNHEAEKLKSQIRKFRERNPYYHFGLGRTALKEGRYEDAVSHMRKAIRLHREQPRFLVGLAHAYQKLGRERKAQRLIEKAKTLAAQHDQPNLFDLKLQRMMADN